MAGTRRWIGSALAILAGGALVFEISSAYLVSRGMPAWLAGTIGALAFPLGPVAWHIVGELRRRRRIVPTSSKSALTAIDRFWLRFAAVTLLVIGPMLAIGRFDVARAVWHHATWFVPIKSRPVIPSDLAPLLRRVPDEAELVIVLRRSCLLSGPTGVAIAAWGNGQAAVVADKAIADKDLDTEVASLLDERRKYPFFPFDGLARIDMSDPVAFASNGWRDGVANDAGGVNDRLLGLLASVPSDAALAIAFAPRTVRGVPVRSGAAWMRSNKAKHSMVIEVRVEASDAAAATKLATDARPTLAALPADEKCRAQLREVASSVTIERDGEIVTARTEIATDELYALMRCF